MPGDLALFMIAIGVLIISVAGYQAAQHIKNSTLREAIDMGCKTAGSLAYYVLVNLNGTAGTTASAAIAQAIESGLDHVNHALPDAIAKLGVDQTTLTNKIKGKFAELLAIDPNISPEVLTHLPPPPLIPSEIAGVLSIKPTSAS